MRKLPLYVLKERIAFAYDPDSIVDMLDISVEQLLEAFEDSLIKKRNLFDHLEEEVEWEEQEEGVRWWPKEVDIEEEDG